MKIGILTFHASHNYGSMLQAYALQHVLSQMGHQNIIINLRTDAQKCLVMPQLEWEHPKSSLLNFLRMPCTSIALQRKYNRFEYFLKNQLYCTQEYSNREEVEEDIKCQHYDAVIVGSDQIWNTECIDFDASYLLYFNLPIRKIAYAPSLGLHPECLSEADKQFLAKHLIYFHSLSTREERGAKVIKEISGLDAKVVLDPSLLLDKFDYQKLSYQKPIVKGKYIFYYSPIDQPEIFEKALLLSQKTNLKIVTTQYQPYYKGKDILHINDCGPREFLNIVQHACFTIGKSFHLLAFSLIFEKEFFIVTGDTDSRIANLLNPIRLNNRTISLSQKDLAMPPAINYTQVQKRMDALKKDSMNFLKNALR